MAYTQQINQEQKDLATEPKLILVQKYSPETETYLSYKYRIKNRRHVLKKLQRASVVIKAQKTDKTRKLHPKATLVAETVLNKIAYSGEEEAILTHKYLNKITDCLADQNKRHIKQLANLFDAKYERAYLKDGIFYEYCYVFKLNPAITEELKEAGVLESEFIPAKKPRSINNKDISNEIRIRSRANFSNSNFTSKASSAELIENSSGVVRRHRFNPSTDTKPVEQSETLHGTQAVETASPITEVATPTETKAGLTNKRKTKTREERKQRKTWHIANNGFLGKGKRLREVQPYLTDEVCEKLRSGSGRAFSNRAIREITKAIALSNKGSQAFFYHINGLVAYLIPALIREKRDPNKVGGENYYTLAGMTAEGKLWHQREKYLASVEEEAIRHINPKNHFRAKLANVLEHTKAYEFLLAFVNAEMEDSVLKITLNKAVELSEQELDIVLFQARAVFNKRNANGVWQHVEAIQYVVNAANSNFREIEKEQGPELPTGKWGKICAEFVAEFGMNMYKYWIAPLHVAEDNELILLSSNSGMILDRIMEKYWKRMSYYSEVHNIDLNIKYIG